MQLKRIFLAIAMTLLVANSAMADTIDRVQFKAGGLAFVWNSAGESQRITASSAQPAALITGTLDAARDQTLQLGGADTRFAVASNTGFTIEAQLIDPFSAAPDASFALRMTAGSKAHAPTAASMQRISVRDLQAGKVIYTSARRTAAHAGAPQQQAIQFELVADFGDKDLPAIDISVRLLQ